MVWLSDSTRRTVRSGPFRCGAVGGANPQLHPGVPNSARHRVALFQRGILLFRTRLRRLDGKQPVVFVHALACASSQRLAATAGVLVLLVRTRCVVGCLISISRTQRLPTVPVSVTLRSNKRKGRFVGKRLRIVHPVTRVYGVLL